MVKVEYSSGPCKGPCCPNGDSHSTRLDVPTGVGGVFRFVRGKSIDLPDPIAVRLCADHPAFKATTKAGRDLVKKELDRRAAVAAAADPKVEVPEAPAPKE